MFAAVKRRLQLLACLLYSAMCDASTKKLNLFAEYAKKWLRTTRFALRFDTCLAAASVANVTMW